MIPDLRKEAIIDILTLIPAYSKVQNTFLFAAITIPDLRKEAITKEVLIIYFDFSMVDSFHPFLKAFIEDSQL
jgi:hypothetical protein